MKPDDILRAMRADGLVVVLHDDAIKLAGPAVTVARWRETVRDNKAALIELEKVGAGDTALDSMTADDEKAIRAWLAYIGETDPATIDDVLTKCSNHTDARDYFIQRAVEPR